MTRLLPGRDRILSRTRAFLVLSAAVVVLVVLVVAVVWGVRAADRHHTVDDNRMSLRAHAGQIVATVFTVDRAHWEADRARAREVIGGDFASTFATALRSPPADGTAAVTWSPGTVALIDVDTESGAALIRSNVVTRTDDGHEETTARTVRAGFVRHGEGWLLTSAEVIT
ncbi:hypothetical protein GYA93_19915 [Gordonia desulfuricans]|uniref:Mammalian cell entry protein n=1 Tax=Gordonia desulfuricans TaxID=89051 RepID=A0A7K3LUG3_9ACTN|nr:hypothetical protein [Gordonia desulfuricans]NDK91819.1 hypothetical protein [Gordonia desulfuricans]